MRLAIIGLSNSGRTTLFNALTKQNIETTIYPTIAGDPHYGVVKVPDTRVDRLASIYRPKKVTHATVEYIDYIGLTKGDLSQNKKVFDLIKDVDAVVHVVRAFKDDSVIHPLGSIDPLRDLETVEMELIFGDLELIEKRLTRMEEGFKKGKKPDEAEKRLLLKCKDHLEREIPLRNLSFSEEEQKAMRHLQFVSIKPEVIVFNIGEGELNSDGERDLLNKAEAFMRERVKDPLDPIPYSILSLCGKIEMELSQLSEDDAEAFLKDLGIKEPALNKLIHVSYALLGLISFLTAGEDEVRAWTIKRGTPAQKAAGKIHSDIEKGFIRAEVIGFDDFINCSNMAIAREKGLLRLEGKTYEVRDGDIINFRFNV